MTNTYKINTDNNKIYLNPGDLIITSSGRIVWTLLGSCISIIFHSTAKKLSAICHAQLPYDKSSLSCKSSCPEPCGKIEYDEFKFVTCSFKYMLDAFHDQGIPNSKIKVSLYGGASMFNVSKDIFRIGDMNISKAKELIKENNLTIIQEDTGGCSSRSLTHYSETGITELNNR